MKALDSFTVERLEEILNFDLPRHPAALAEIVALARIALAAKRAEPVGYADKQAFENFRNGTATKEWMWAAPDSGLIALHTTPQLNSPEIPEGWIKCRDQMPEKEIGVIAFSDDGSMWIAYYDKESRCWDDGDFFNDIPEITHWMPLPAPPEKPL